MSGFISALIKQRKDAKNAEPDTSGRLKELLGIIKKYDYSDGITPEIIVDILEDMGPTFVKIGQIASQQAEYIPPDYCDALAKLRSNVAPMDIETVHAQIEKHLGKPTDELFASFDEKALGSASIAQVHKAQLFDGTTVAVKVRRPGVVETVARDFALIEKILDQFVKGDVGGIDIKSLIVELEKTSKIELDFTNEANNFERFWENNKDREKVISPKVYRDLTCEAVMTEDFASGHEVSDIEFLDTLSDEERLRLATLLADNFASQVLEDGFYHADPHSGNVFIRELDPNAPKAEEVVEKVVEEVAEEAEAQVDEAAGAEGGEGKEEPADEPKVPLPDHEVEWIDFGMMGTLTKKQQQMLIDIVTSVVMKDAYGLKRSVLQVAKPVGEVDHGALLELCEGMCSQYSGSDFGDFNLGDLLGTILNSLQDANYKIDPFLTNLARGIVAMEGTIKTLSPEVNILNSFTDKVDIGLGINLDLENPENMNPDIALKLLQLVNGVIDSSVKTAETLDMLEKGQIRVRTDFSFEEKALGTVKQLTGYLVRALLIVALLIGSSLLCTAAASAAGGAYVALPIVGCAGYVVSVFFSYCLYRDMKKDSKKDKDK